MSSEITVGMSAPPIGMISSTPNTSASATMTGNSSLCEGSTTSTTTSAMAAASMPRFM